jgi:hypothetical protein
MSAAGFLGLPSPFLSMPADPLAPLLAAKIDFGAACTSGWLRM